MIKWYYSFTRFLAMLLFKIFFRLQAKGKEFIPQSGGFILASNHVSILDPIALGIACSRRLNYMAKEELFRNSLFSFLLRSLGAFPVKRRSHDVGAIREALRRLKSGSPLLMFPEGGRSKNGEILVTKLGIAMIAVHTSVPVLPAFIKGSERALSKGSKFIRPVKIIVNFGKPFYINKNQTYEETTNYIRERIVSLSEKTT